MEQTESKPRYVSRWEQAAESPTGIVSQLRWHSRRLFLDMMGVLATTPQKPFAKGLCCHYVFDDQLNDFENHLVGLMKLGQFVDANAFFEMATGRRPIDGPTFHLSFDDGFKNVFTNAVPILERLNIPATLFLPTALIGADLLEAEAFRVREKLSSGPSNLQRGTTSAI